MGWFSDLFGFGKKKRAATDKIIEEMSKAAKSSANVIKGRVNTRLLNARKEPDKKGKVLYKLRKHTIVNIKASYEMLYGLIESAIFRIAVLNQSDVSDIYSASALAIEGLKIR